MGMYTAVAIDLKFLSDVPAEVLQLINKYVECSGPDDSTNSLFCCYSSYFKEWEVREFRKHRGQWTLKTRASTKSPEERTIRLFMTVMYPFLDIAPDTAVVRTIYEDGCTETIYYYDEAGAIIKGEGWQYKDYWEDNHPRTTVDFDPPANIHELRKALAGKKCNDDETRGGYGF